MHVPEIPGGRIGGIVFDAVGTLIEPDPPVADVYRAAALRQGVAIELSDVTSRFRRAFLDDENTEARGSLETDEQNELRRWRRIVGTVLPELSDLDRAFTELWEHFGRSDAWRYFDDVVPSITALAPFCVPMAIASNFDGRLRNVIGGSDGISDLLCAVVISSEVGYRKPHPAFYDAVCNRLGLAPRQILYVGDDVENDLRGSQRAGFRAVLIDRKPKPARGIVHVADLHAVVAMVRAANSR